MPQKRTHHSHRTPGFHKPKGFERFLNSRLFIVLGSIFLLIGLYSSLSSSSGSNEFYNLILSFFAPGADVPAGPDIAGTGLTELILYFLPAVIVLIGTLIFAGNYRGLTLPISILSAIYLIVIQIKISFFNTIFGGCFYPDFYTAILFLWLPAFLLLANSLIHRKSALLILTCFYFYISVVLLYQNFPARIEFFFGFILLCSLLITGIGQKIEKPVNHLINFIFAWGYFGLFWLRKLVVNSRPEFLPLFFIFGIFFYLLFYAVVLYTSAKKDNPVHHWIHLVINGSNLLAFVGTTCWVLIHYTGPGYLPLFVAALLLFNLLGIYFIKKYRLATWTLPYHYGVMILAALVLPVLVQQNRLILFTAVLSVLMLVYANTMKERSAFWISLGSLFVMSVFYLYSWFWVCLPAHFAFHNLPESSLLVYGILMGLVVTGALGFTSWYLQTAELPHSKNWFRKKKYDRLVRILFLFSLFLTLGWLGFCIAFQFTGSLSYTPVAWFSTGALFFIGVIRYYSGKQSSFKKPLLYLACAFAVLYPLMVHWNMAVYRTTLILRNDLNLFVILIHYLALVLVYLLGRMIIRRIRRHFIKNTDLLRGLEFLTVSFILFLLITEYDNLSVILSVLQNSPGLQQTGGDPLAMNMFLPYSVIIWVVSAVVFYRAIVRRNKFLRNLAIVLFLGMLIKLFAFDIPELGPGSGGIVYISLGLFLFASGFVYSRLLKGESIFPEFKRSGSASGAKVS